MIVPTDEVRNSLQQMVAHGELAVGDEMPRHGELCTLFGLRKMQCSKVLWELTVNNEIDRIDVRHFYGEAPANTRSKEQILFILLRIIAEGHIAEGDEFYRSLTIKTAFNTSTAIVQAVVKELVSQGLISDKHKCKRVEKGALRKAANIVESFRFTLTVLESQVDECLERIETASTMSSAHKQFQDWRRENVKKEEALFLCWQLRKKFGLASLDTVNSAGWQISDEQRADQAKECREWLRRHHVINANDGLLVDIANL